MQFTFFEIGNFRGIQKTRLNLAAIPNSHIYTLVGLNESGKSTILEAINHFTYKNENLDPLELPGYSISDPHTLIPISARLNFNKETFLKFGLELDKEDETAISKYMLDKHGFILDKEIGNITIYRSEGFKDSKHDPKLRKNAWNISLRGKNQKGRKSIELPSKSTAWQETANFIKGRMPSVLFFPNFLFDFPDKIYLEDGPEKSQRSKFYRLLIQDILDALNKDINLQTHIIERTKSTDSNDKRSLDGLLLEMGRNVTEVVFGAWNKIFHQEMGQKRISIKCDYDESQRPYLEFKVEDTDGIFLINERSLGFRWFFVFLLLTQYRGFRKDSPNSVLFLFDEPASNLHPSAQAQLIKSFEKLSEKCRIIYTTHSHHLINPEWLESVFVVKNEGLKYGKDEINYNANKTDISVTRYREFAVKHPNQTDYYRPILDVLDYAPSHFDFAPDVIMVEGKNDYYVIRYMQLLLKNDTLKFLPGTSSSNLEVPIRLYIAWGCEFIVLLDSDREGKKQKARYEDLFEMTLINRVFTLADIDLTWQNFEMESLFLHEDKLAIQNFLYPTETNFNKKNFNRSIQELLIKKTIITLSEDTKKNFEAIFNHLEEKLAVNKAAE